MKVCHLVEFVLHQLDWMESGQFWPNGFRYLWTDVFGVILLASLAEELREDQYLSKVAWLVDDVYRVLGRERGIRIGQAPDRDDQYFHYLVMWMYALFLYLPFPVPVLRRRYQ